MVSRGRSSRFARSQCSTSTPTLTRRARSSSLGKSFGGGASALGTGIVGAFSARSVASDAADAEGGAADEPPPASLSQPPTTTAPPASATAAATVPAIARARLGRRVPSHPGAERPATPAEDSTAKSGTLSPMPFSRRLPRKANRRSGIPRTASRTVVVTRTSPGRAWLQTRAARLTAVPTKPSSCCVVSPALMPMPTLIGPSG